MLQQNPDGTRQRLVRAALDLFTTAGFRATTTPMIAERAGVAEGTIYRHFKGKEALLNEGFREAQLWGTSLLREEMERGGRAPEILQRFARRLVEAAAQFPAAARMLLQAPPDRHFDERSREAAREFRAALQQVIASGKSDGLVRSGAADLWASVWLAVVTFAAERVAARDWTPDHAHVTATCEAAWSAVQERTSSPAAAAGDWPSPPAAPAPDPAAEPRAPPY
jgi:AcrR family transcriptional regulator